MSHNKIERDRVWHHRFSHLGYGPAEGSAPGGWTSIDASSPERTAMLRLGALIPLSCTNAVGDPTTRGVGVRAEAAQARSSETMTPRIPHCHGETAFLTGA